MPNIMTIGCMSSGHDDCPPVPAITGSATMAVSNQPVVCIGDHFAIHSCGQHDPHSGVVTTGSTLMEIDGIPVAIEGSQIGGGGCTAEHICQIGDALVSIEC